MAMAKPQRARVDGLKQSNWARVHDDSAPLWTTIAEAADQLGVPMRTIQSWARRMQITSACCLQTGRLMVNAAEVTQRRRAA